MQNIDETIKNLAVELVDQNQLGSFNDIEVLIGSGGVNQIFLVSANDSKFVLRLNGLSEMGRFKKEQWCIDTTLANGIPGSRVIDIGEYDEYAYTFIEFIKGRNDRDIVETNDLWYLLGKYLLKIHSITVKGFGENLEDILNGSRNQWTQYLNYNISSLNSSDVLIKMGVLNKNSSRSVKDLLERLSEKDFKFGLNHGDYSLSNIIVDEYSVPHVIDWGSAQAHIVPHHDLGVILDESLEEESEEYYSLLSGYQMIRADYETIRDEIVQLYLLESIDKLRWALDVEPSRVDYYIKQLHRYLNRANVIK